MANLGEQRESSTVVERLSSYLCRREVSEVEIGCDSGRKPEDEAKRRDERFCDAGDKEKSSV